MQQLEQERVSTGIRELDEILGGGFIRGNSYLVRGAPGVGKTMLGMHLLAEGARQGEPVLFVALSETPASVRTSADGVSIDLAGVDFLDLTPGPEFFSEDQSYDIFSPAEVERGPMVREIVEAVESLQPTRVFVDTVTQLRYLSADRLAFRRQVFSLLRYLTDSGATVLFTSEHTEELSDRDLQFMSDGVICLTQNEGQRAIEVVKFRSSGVQGGRHGVRIDGEGLKVFPRLVIPREMEMFDPKLLSTGVPNLDDLLGGGIEESMVTLISGPMGIGKTTLGVQMLVTAALDRNEVAIGYLFDEGKPVLCRRASALGIPVEAALESGRLRLEPVESLHLSVQEYAQRVRRDVEREDVKVVMLDSLFGYRLALQGEAMETSLHALTRYLRARGISVILTDETDVGADPLPHVNDGFNYLIDVAIFLRYFSMDGELRRSIGVLKKRLGYFDPTVYGFDLTSSGIRVGRTVGPGAGKLYGVPQVSDEELTSNSDDE